MPITFDSGYLPRDGMGQKGARSNEYKSPAKMGKNDAELLTARRRQCIQIWNK